MSQARSEKPSQPQTTTKSAAPSGPASAGGGAGLTAQLRAMGYQDGARALAPDAAEATPGDGAGGGGGKGMPGNLRSGIEGLSGLDMSDVAVHRNSSKPAEVGALAYAQGSDIHLGPGQEGHLPHEAWHVVQQKQGRVPATLQKKGMGINDDSALEREADVMGSRALSGGGGGGSGAVRQAGVSSPVVQRVGDKMAMGYHDIDDEDVKKLQEGVKAIYERHKLEKKQRRDKLDQDYQTQSQNLDEKQAYLMLKLEQVLMTKITADGTLGVDFSTQIGGMAGKLTEATKNSLGQVVLQAGDTSALDIQADTLANKLVPEIKTRMKERGEGGKKVNKAAWKSAISEYARDYGRHGVADAIVHGYEKGYQKSGMDKKALVKEWTEFAAKEGYDLLVNTDGDIAKVSVNPQKDVDKDFEIATIYFNDARFVKKESIVINKGTKEEEVRDIYAHRETGEEYVQDAFDAFVTRYVHRALNKYDNPAISEKKPEEGVSIKADPRKKKGTNEPWKDIAAKVPTMKPEEQTEEIRNHQRAKELQGGSPFVSFTTTGRPIFGSSAKNFEGEHGVATVDLAQISKQKVFDTHNPEAMKKIHGIENPDPDMPFKEKDDLVERNAAARDAMRTREVVVAGDIPEKAITRVKVEGKEWKKSLDGKHKPPEQVDKEIKALVDRVLKNLGLSPTIEDVD